MKEVIYPMEAKTPAEKTNVLYRLQELLRLEHNERGADYNAGIITKAQWEGYKNLVFNPESDAIVEDILKYRYAMKQDVSYLITLNESFKDGI